jgi:5-(carboxyamino)imidazole ribonucleotide synthase
LLNSGSTIGILGGGQLGRMLAMSAAQLGLRVHIYAPDEDSVAAEVAARFTCAAWDDSAALTAFAADCDAITFEFENIEVGPLAVLQAKVAPCLRALEVAQDRMMEKNFVAGLGGSPAPYAAVTTAQDLGAAIADIGTPGIIKTCRDGYDGKGQWRIMKPGDAAAVELPGTPCVYEGFVHFECEFSVILVRGQDGEVRFWDSAHNTHEDGILAHSVLPAPEIVGQQVPAARALAQRVAEALGYVGVMTCEFFATQSGPVFNEMAPRVHNSGHWTIEGAMTSQFENHIRAVAGLPLGDTSSISPRIVMDNLIGAEALDIARHLSNPAAHLHLYGKGEAREGRKMGHVTYVG